MELLGDKQKGSRELIKPGSDVASSLVCGGGSTVSPSVDRHSLHLMHFKDILQELFIFLLNTE